MNKRTLTFLATVLFLLANSALANTAYIDIKHFAESYEPKSTEFSKIPKPPIPPKGVIHGINYMKNAHRRDHEKYIVLIFLKLYRFHIENFKQSYELREKPGKVSNPLLEEFCRLSNIECVKIEFLSSSIAKKWMELPRPYWKNAKILKEIRKISNATK